MPNNLCKEGERKSASTSKTLWPSCASEMARLQATVVLPSAGCVLVTKRELGGLSGVESKTEVRRLRNASPRAACCAPSRSMRCQEREFLPEPFPARTRDLSRGRNLWMPRWLPFAGATTGIRAKEGPAAARRHHRLLACHPCALEKVRRKCRGLNRETGQPTDSKAFSA